MIARKEVGIILIAVSILLIFGCGREKPKNDFELGKEYFLASNYVQSMIRLQRWVAQYPSSQEAAEADAMLAVIYHDDETRQPLFEAKLKKLQEMGEPGITAVLRLTDNPTTASRLGGTVNDILVKAGELSVVPLMKDLRGPNPRLRRNAWQVLTQIGAPAVESLIGLLDDPSPYTRSQAAEALSKIGDKRAVEPLRQRLNDSSKLVQVQVAAALYGMGEKNPIEKKVMIGALEGENVEARRAAARATWELIDDPPLRSLLKAMRDTDPVVRNYAALAVGKTPSTEAIQPLLRILEEDEDEQARGSAAKSLEKIGKPAVEPLIELLEGTKDMELTVRIVQILGDIRDKRADEPLDKLYNEATNPLLKNEVAKALNKIR